MVRFEELVDFIERRAPFDLQESWDRSGVWLGLSKDARAVAVALEIEDFNEEIIQSADVLIVHHPPFLKSEAEMSEIQRKTFEKAKKAGKSLIVMHTNADVCRNSFVDLILKKASVTDAVPFKNAYVKRSKVIVFVPPESVDSILNLLKSEGLSNVGFYAACAFMSHGKGHFCALHGANPYVDFAENCEAGEEIRIEFEVPCEHLERAVSKIADLHPYEEPVIDVYEVRRFVKGAGLGRIFELQSSAEELVEAIIRLGIKVEDVVLVKNAAGKTVFVPGSGRNLVLDVIKYSADTFVSGDLGYHDKKNLTQQGINLIEVNHATVESFFVEWLEDELSQFFGERLKILRREHESNRAAQKSSGSQPAD